MKFKEYILEEYDFMFRGVEIFKNPDSTDIKELVKLAKKSSNDPQVRFIIVPKTKSVYLWDAWSMAFHWELFDTGKLPRKDSIWGYAYIDSGKLAVIKRQTARGEKVTDEQADWAKKLPLFKDFEIPELNEIYIISEYKLAGSTDYFKKETLTDVPWIYKPDTGLWYIKDGVIYNNGELKKKLIKRYYDFTWSHLDIGKYFPDLQDYYLAGRIQNGVIKVYNHYDIGDKQREFLEKKALDAVYKYIKE
jgi:hypothetical protein